MEQVISVYKLVKMKNDIIPKHVFTKSFDPQHEGPIAIDVTKVVQDWLEDPGEAMQSMTCTYDDPRHAGQSRNYNYYV